ncbi:glycosyltransferase family 4 protein [Chryseobacterium foetidum]|uniref:glycosyltransferase family 4 protein n=1 Tax=Chryseobacterium foetidum TaxID=2951057 RepID=UPI0021C6CAFB|nr:glycosyltransferase family 1 protein [Chryseobacterium foetidum]
MKIAVSGDCFSAFTSGFPVRGMMLALVKLRKEDKFVFFYRNIPKSPLLQSFYRELHEQTNVSVVHMNAPRKVVAIKSMLCLSSIKLDGTFDVFLNPGNPEYIKNFQGVQINSIADLSTIHGFSTIKFALFWKLHSKWSKKYIFKFVNKIVCISKYTENDVHKVFPNNDSKTVVIYNGIDDFWFDQKFVDNSIYNFKEKKYFIWWGNISQRKNIKGLFAAYDEALKVNPNIPKLLIVGNFQKDQLFLKSKLGDDIETIPFQDNYTMKTLVKNSSGLIFPSFYEGFGLPVIEAFSQGIPVACSNITSLPEIANDFALLFDPFDINEMKEAILNLNNFKVDRNKIIAYASNFKFEIAAQKYSELLNSL